MAMSTDPSLSLPLEGREQYSLPFFARGESGVYVAERGGTGRGKFIPVGLTRDD